MWVIYARLDLPKVVVGLATLHVVFSFLRPHRWIWLGWTVFAAAAFVHYPIVDLLARHAWPKWLWQVALVTSGLVRFGIPVNEGHTQATRGGQQDVSA